MCEADGMGHSNGGAVAVLQPVLVTHGCSLPEPRPSG